VIPAWWNSDSNRSRSGEMGMFKLGVRRGYVGVFRGEVMVLPVGLGRDGCGILWLFWVGREMEKSRHVADLTSWWP